MPEAAEILAKGEVVAQPSRRWHLWMLAGLTLLAAGMRFYRLERPPIWFDEALTFSRVCGTWEQMCHILRSDGFMPLHYWVTWVLAQMAYPTPWVLRLIPALCGVAMVPAMYFLARQLASRRAALLAALFTACSAYLLAFSRDAKMYMQCWFFTVTFAGVFIWWLRAGSRRWYWQVLGWMGWTLAGLLAVWMHATALVVIGMSAAWMLTSWARPWHRNIGRWLGYGAGVGLIVGSCWLYYHLANTWFEKTGGLVPVAAAPATEDRWSNANWDRHSGVGWIQGFHKERTPWEVARHTLGVFLTGWEWPSPFERDEMAPDGSYMIPRWTISIYVWTLTGLVACGTLALLPWGWWFGGSKQNRTSGEGDGPGVQVAEEERPLRGVAKVEEVSPGVVWFWLLLWVLAPMYAFYARSYADFLWPWEMVWAGIKTWWLALPAFLLAGAWASAWVLRPAHRPWKPLVQGVAGTLVIFLVLCVIGVVLRRAWAVAQERDLEWSIVWWPRYLGVLLPALYIMLAVLLARIPTLLLRWTVVGALLAVNLGTYGARVELDMDAPWHEMAEDIWQFQQHVQTTALASYNLENDPNRVWPLHFYLHRPQGKYQYCLAGRLLPEPEDFRNGGFGGRLYPPAGAAAPMFSRLKAALARRPQVERLIVWERHPAGDEPPAAPATDRYLNELGPSWQKESQQMWHVREHFNRSSREWNWQRQEWLVRRVYVKGKGISDAP